MKLQVMKLQYLLVFFCFLQGNLCNEQYKSGPFDKREETFHLWYDEFNQWVQEASQGNEKTLPFRIQFSYF